MVTFTEAALPVHYMVKQISNPKVQRVEFPVVICELSHSRAEAG